MKREQKTPFDVLAEWVCLPCLLAAAILYALVTSTPDALFRRDLIVAAFVVAGLGAGLVNLRARPRALRLLGATTMVVGLAAAVCILLW